MTNSSLCEKKFTMVFKGDSTWSLQPKSSQEFKKFLDKEIKDLENLIPMEWENFSKDNSDFRDIINKYLYSSSDQYRNKSIQCSFVKKLLKNLSGEAQVKLASITDNGNLCMGSDLKKEKRSEWIESLSHFFWFNPWLEYKGELISLEKLIKIKIGQNNYKRPKIQVAKNTVFNGTGWSYSQNEFNLFSEVSLLRDFSNISSKYDPNKTEEFELLGEDTRKMLKEWPYGSAGNFKVGTEIYVTNDWGAADLVELLVHEYGHIYHAERSDNISWNSKPKELVVDVEHVHAEAVAESFSWLLLNEVYPIYPEIKYFHLAKLKVFHEFRSSDPHVIGANISKEKFHFATKGSFSDLEFLAKIKKLDDYLYTYSPDSISRGSKEKTTKLNIKF